MPSSPPSSDVSLKLGHHSTIRSGVVVPLQAEHLVYLGVSIEYI